MLSSNTERWLRDSRFFVHSVGHYSFYDFAMIMRALALAVLLALPALAQAQSMNKCTDAAGKVVYQSTPCGANARDSRKITVDKSTYPLNKGGGPKVSDEVIAQCFRGYQRGTRDPTTTKLVDWYTRFGGEGYPIVVLDVVLPPVRGTAKRTQLWCRLNHDMTINKLAMNETWWEFYREQNGL